MKNFLYALVLESNDSKRICSKHYTLHAAYARRERNLRSHRRWLGDHELRPLNLYELDGSKLSLKVAE